jgi:trk system potassium uptake protein TrkA
VRVIVIGAGKIGRHLVRELAEAGHAVTVAESDGEVARRLAESVDALVLEGDGTSMSILKDAEVSRADWLLAVTGQDEVNLTACELAETMGAKRVLARLNDPRNRATFDALGIPVVAVTDLISQLISREIDFFHLERIALLARGRISLIEIEVGPEIPARRVVELGLPAQTVIVAVTREKNGGEVLVPRGDTVIEPGDRVLAVTSVDHESEVRAALRRPPAAQGNDR